MDEKAIRQYLKKHGITTNEDLERALGKMKPLDITYMVTSVRSERGTKSG